MYILFVISGYLSTVFALITQIPQIVTIIKHKSGKNLSYIYLGLIMSDCIMYILYGTGFLLDNNYDGIPIILSGVIPFMISSILLILKIYFTIKKKQLIANGRHNIEKNEIEEDEAKCNNTESISDDL